MKQMDKTGRGGLKKGSAGSETRGQGLSRQGGGVRKIRIGLWGKKDRRLNKWVAQRRDGNRFRGEKNKGALEKQGGGSKKRGAQQWILNTDLNEVHNVISILNPMSTLNMAVLSIAHI